MGRVIQALSVLQEFCCKGGTCVTWGSEVKTGAFTTRCALRGVVWGGGEAGWSTDLVDERAWPWLRSPAAHPQAQRGISRLLQLCFQNDSWLCNTAVSFSSHFQPQGRRRRCWCRVTTPNLARTRVSLGDDSRGREGRGSEGVRTVTFPDTEPGKDRSENPTR